MSKVTALLPMKAHSARVKSKNFRDIAGKPLFRWILDSLMDSSSIDQVVINTDAREILAKNGLKDGDYEGRLIIRDRKKELLGDFTSMNLILEDDIAAIDSDLYFMTHTTNPLLRAETIDDLIAKFKTASEKNEADSVFTVNAHQTRFYTEDAAPINHDPNNLIRTQDLAPYMEENSVAYVFTRESFSKTKARIGHNPLMIVTPRLESVDIDEVWDWYMAESLLMRVAAGEDLPKEN